MDFHLNLPTYKDSDEFQIIDPATQEPMGVWLTLARSGTQTHMAAKHRVQNKITEAYRKGSRNTAQIADAGELDILVACTTAWRFSPEVLNGEQPPECNPENVKAFYKKHPTIRDAADQIRQDQEAFRC